MKTGMAKVARQSAPARGNPMGWMGHQDSWYRKKVKAAMTPAPIPKNKIRFQSVGKGSFILLRVVVKTRLGSPEKKRGALLYAPWVYPK